MGGWRGYTGTLPSQSQGPILTIFSLEGPTHGQMKAISQVSMRFPRKGPRIDLELTSNDPQIDPPDDLPDWSSDVPQMPISRTSDIPMSRIGPF